MSTKESKRKQFQYKNIVLQHINTSLAVLIRNALSKGKLRSPINRTEKLGNDDVERLINRSEFSQGMLIAELVLIELGKAPQTIDLKPKDDHYPVELLTELAEDQALLETSAFIGIVDNHMLVIPSRGFSAKDVNAHLLWFLRKYKPDQELDLYLMDIPSKKLSELEKKGDLVTSVVIGSHLGVSSTDQNEITFNNNAAYRFLKDLIKKNFVRTLTPENLEEISKIRVKVQINYSRPDKESERRTSLLKILASVNNLPGEDIKVLTKGGVTIQGDEARLRIPVTVATVNGNIDFSGLEIIMREAFKELIEETL